MILIFCLFVYYSLKEVEDLHELVEMEARKVMDPKSMLKFRI